MKKVAAMIIAVITVLSLSVSVFALEGRNPGRETAHDEKIQYYAERDNSDSGTCKVELHGQEENPSTGAPAFLLPGVALTVAILLGKIE